MTKHPLLVSAMLAFGLFCGSPAAPRGADAGMSADVLSVSIRSGGEQSFVIDAGPSYAGFRYVIVGSASGVFPGMVQDQVIVPLNQDSYSAILVEGPDEDVYKHFRGRLDGAGRAKASVILPKGRAAEFVGTVYHHAAVLIDPSASRIVASTNPVELLLLP